MLFWASVMTILAPPRPKGRLMLRDCSFRAMRLPLVGLWVPLRRRRESLIIELYIGAAASLKNGQSNPIRNFVPKLIGFRFRVQRLQPMDTAHHGSRSGIPYITHWEKRLYKDPTPEGPVLVHPRGAKGVITVTGSLQISGVWCHVSATDFDPLGRSCP